MKPTFSSLLQDLMQNEKFQQSMIEQLADFGDRLVRDILAIPEGGIGEGSLEEPDIWPEIIGLEGKSHCYSQLIETISDAVLRIDRSGIIRGANAAAESLLGQPRKELIDKSFLDLIHPPDRDKLFELWTASLKNQQQAFHIRLKNGGKSHLKVAARAIPIAKGTDFAGSLLIISPQTSSVRKRKTKQTSTQVDTTLDSGIAPLPVEISTEKIRRLLHEIKEIFYIASANRTITYVNPEIENILGYTPQEFLTMNIEEKFTDPQDRIRFSKLLELHGWVKDFRYNFLHKNGQICCLSETAALITDRNDQITGYYGIIRDRTAEYQIEKALKESEENYRFLVEQFPYALILLDNKGRILHTNRRGTQFLNADSIQSIKGRSVFDLCSRENADLLREGFVSASAGDAVSNNWQWTDNTGTLHWWTMTLSPIIRNSEVEKIIWICKEADREKRLENQMLLSQKMETVETLIRGLAHDFNNQLGVILGNASFVKDQLDKDSEHYEELDAIESTALKARIMMDQLMTFTPNSHHQSEPVAINSLIKNLVDFVMHSFPKNITIETFLNASPDIAVGDPNNLYQAFLNVCVNSRDAMPNGGHITVSSKNVVQESFFHGQGSDRFIQISISDDGQGMDEGTARRICEPFFTTKAESEGIGLGMCATYSIIQHHGGFLEIDSKEGRGTKIDIYIPQADETAERGDSIEDDAILGRTASEPDTVLIVDDEPQVRMMIQRILEKEDFKVFLAENGVKALESLKKHDDEIHLVILDLTMPQMGGSEALSRIRERYPNIPVLLSSGFPIDNEIQELTKQEHTYFINKPYRRSAILEAIRQILSKSIRFPSE